MAAYWYQGHYCRLVVPYCLKNTFGTSIQYLARQSVLYSQTKNVTVLIFLDIYWLSFILISTSTDLQKQEKVTRVRG